MIPNVSRSTLIQDISGILINEIFVTSVEHIAIPVILGLSLEDMTPQELAEMGKFLTKPPLPVKDNHKLTIYNRMKEYYRPIITPIISKSVNAILIKVASPLSYVKLKALADKIKNMDKLQEAKWARIKELFEDHICLYKQLEAKTGIEFNAVELHDALCPTMAYERDNRLLQKINVDEILELNDNNM